MAQSATTSEEVHHQVAAADRVSSQEVSKRLAVRGLSLPEPWRIPISPDVKIPAQLVRVVGSRVFISGHVPISKDGQLTGPYGKIGDTVGLPSAQDAAVRTVLSMVASVERTVGDLDRVKAWCRLHCMANAVPGFFDFPAVFNPASQLLLDMFGEDIGYHARVAVGVAGLPWDVPVEIAAELELHPE
ncbi:RidA family protein [Streptomyces sp. NBS 14/10]|uniref:RidA family protein n=1 Tax=Streptomyces sp. NBS 14/10 TaxID=1945643 RepID=UPI001C52B2D8|nr:RidA family protein [Streptomyces sp. NBS 14/10]KAK1182754.1 RidA family protein [Streptomyces sp. NBS 14/10]